MENVNYAETRLKGKEPVVWAYVDRKDLEGSLSDYYGKHVEEVTITPVSEETARQTTAWDIFKKLERLHNAFNLGSLVAEYDARSQRF
ncbi:MAG: hypothetical protein KKG75_01400 [Nanoarchaeota archaeon]|nr:hypothetical protein [Nanoarchaeota archaeon]